MLLLSILLRHFCRIIAVFDTHDGSFLLLSIVFLLGAAGGTHAESRRCGGGQLPLFSGWQGPQQKLQDTAQGFLPLCLAHP